MLTRLQTFARDARGSTAILAALTSVAAIGFAALAIDTGSFFYERRKLQTASDLAAIAAAGDIHRARAAALATLALNGYGPEALANVETGIYLPDPHLAPAERFTPGVYGSGNAVRVTAVTRTPLYFGRILMPAKAIAAGGPAGTVSVTDGVTVRTSAVAAAENTAAFAIGSRLVQLDGGLLNKLLGGLLGTSLTLSVMDYRALADTRIDLFGFSDALASRLGLSAATYDQVLSGSAKLPDVLLALGAAARANPGGGVAAAALERLAATIPVDRTVTLASLLSVGPYGSRTVGGPAPVSVAASALDLVSLLAQISNGQRQVQVGLDLGLPGLAGLSLQLAIGERPVGSAIIAVGAAGAVVHTAQTRLLLSAQVAGSPPAALVGLPLYLELAAGTARLAAIDCRPGDNAAAGVTLAVKPALVDAWIGTVSQSDFNNFGRPNIPGPAPLLNVLGLASVSGRAHVTMSNSTEAMLNFTADAIRAGTPQTVSTTDFTATLVSGLVGDLQLKVDVLGLGLGLPSGLDRAVAQTLQQATTPLDQVLAKLLAALGIGLGQADTWVTGSRCGGAVLVN